MVHHATAPSRSGLIARFRAWLGGESWTPRVVAPAPQTPAHAKPGTVGESRAQPSVTHTVHIARMGQCEMPGPLVYRTSSEDEWHTLNFYLVVIRGGGKTIVINTGLPEDLSRLNDLWAEMAGPRCQVTRESDERLGPVLVRLGVNPRTVDYVVATPFKDYLLANLGEFPNATVCVSQRGWTERYLARRYPSPMPDPTSVSDEMVDRLQAGTPNPLRLLRDEDEILPGVRVRWIGVHDRSTIAVIVHTASGDVVITDACLTYEHIEGMVPLGMTESLEACLNAFVMVRQSGQIIVPLHDPQVLERFDGGRIS
jgi:glyoxylase-like metal-dependent hydrolase (beta-lactamase superfamily II)